MFQQWGFLLAEIWVLLALAALIGLIAGWLIFGGARAAPARKGSANRLRSELDQCRAANAQRQAQIVALEADLAEAKSAAPDDTAAKVTPLAVVTPVETVDAGDASQPETLEAPRGGEADDLKKIKGVGPRMENMCNMLGFWHFEQIANWTPAEVAWVDENLEGFKGRVSRDDWVAQAKILAEGGETEFSKKFD